MCHYVTNNIFPRIYELRRMPLLDRDEIEYELERVPLKVQIVHIYIR